jgi:hypothetical protein
VTAIGQSTTGGHTVISAGFEWLGSEATEVEMGMVAREDVGVKRVRTNASEKIESVS